MSRKNKDGFKLIILTGIIIVLSLGLFLNSCDNNLMESVEKDVLAAGPAVAYTVTFSAEGGSTPIPSSKVVTYGTTYGTLATTSRTGYNFAGWWSGSGGTGSEVIISTIVVNASNHNLYAKWTIGTPTVIFYAQGGNTPSPVSKIVTYGSLYGTLATTSRTGYTFAGWWSNPGGTGSEVISSTIVTNASNHELYAKWVPNTYTVTFNSEGGSVPNPSSKVISYGSLYGTLATTSRTGYTFAGWWSDPGGTGSEVIASTIITNASSHGLYAKWTPKNYIVTFDAEDGSTPNPSSKVVTYGSLYGTLATTSRTGYNFAGWWSGSGGTGSEVITSTIVTKALNHSVYAKWVYNDMYNLDLRNTGPSGGLIFYINPNADIDGWKYLEAAVSDQSIGMEWITASYSHAGASGTAVGTGQINTTAIVTRYGLINSYAARICDKLIIGSYNDWFLPSKDELNLMFLNLKSFGLGNFIDTLYWSSSEFSNTKAYYQRFTDGFVGYATYVNSLHVRAVRTF